MNAPVDVFSRDQVDTPANENARHEPKSKQEVHGHRKCPINEEKNAHIHWGTAQGDVLRLFGSADLCVVFAMSFTECAARSVEQVAVVEIFEGVRPDHADEQSSKPAFPGDGTVRGEECFGTNGGEEGA